MSTKLEIPVRLRNLTYDDIVENLRHVCFGHYHLPNPNDMHTTVNTPTAFEKWKLHLLFKYPNASVIFNPAGPWFSRILILDNSFNYDKAIYIKSKSNILRAEGIV